jgi:hypothetical protein
MGPRISLALVIHDHQPVGNFGWVIADVYEKAYEPLLGALERHPGVRISLHTSGPLLEWIRAERPAYIERLRALVERGQVEIVGGGAFEPVLPALPVRDRIGQLRRMGDDLEALFGRRPAGAWLAERVWEPDLPATLADGGYAWTVLDDAHLRAAAVLEDEMWGPYTTEDQGRLVTVFGTERGLRYRIPFHGVDEVIDYLRSHATEAGERIGTMGDDGEKFGAWPGTWEHCWGEDGWVDRFFAALEANAGWLTTTTPSDWLAANLPRGRIAVPTGSYAEMGEWALPPEESRLYHQVLEHALAEGRPEARWMRGASWRNFQVKYREVNDLHKHMLRISASVDAMAPGPEHDRAIDHLYRGQSNDCYWHGLFGGIYISHMRLATHAHLIAAEDLADTAAGRLDAAESLDLDLDGRDEIRLANAGEVVTIDPDEGAGIGDWDVRAVRHALTAAMRRRPEAYHDTLRAAEVATTAVAEAEAETEGQIAATDPAAPASIHDRIEAKEPGLADAIHDDPYERRSGLVRLLDPATMPAQWAAGEAVELGDAVEDPYTVVSLLPGRVVARRNATVRTTVGPAPIVVTKTIEIGGDRRTPTLALTVLLENRSPHEIVARFGIEWTITMLGGGANPAAWWLVDGARTPHDDRGEAQEVATLAQGNDRIGIAVVTTVSEPADAWWAPVETVSNSEGGFERTYQGSGLLLSWPLRLEAGGTRTVTVRNEVTTASDQALG